MNTGDFNTEHDEKRSRTDKLIKTRSIARRLMLSLILTVIVISTIVLMLFYVNPPHGQEMTWKRRWMSLSSILPVS